MAVAFAVFAWLARPLNLLSLGPDSAESRGLDVARAQRAAFFSASLATGAAVSIGGPIGFVGIIIPHLVRLLVGPGSPAGAARVGALRRGVPRRVRPRRADHPRAGGTAGRHHHRPHRGTVLPMAAHQKTLNRRTGVLELLISVVSLCSSWRCLVGGTVAQISKSPNPQIPKSSGSSPSFPAATEMLYAIGAGPRVVGVSSYDSFPPDVKKLPKRRGPARSQRRADAVAEAADGRRLRQPGGSEAAARARRHRRVRLPPRRPRRRDDDDSRARRADRHGARGPRRSRAGSSAGSTASARRSRTARGRARCWCSGASAWRCAASTRAAASASSTTCSTSPAARTCSPTSRSQAVQASTEQILARRPDVILETRAVNSAWPSGDQQAELNVWNALASIPAVRNHRVLFLFDDRIVIPGPARRRGDDGHGEGAPSGRVQMKMLLSWSSGKDSAWTLHTAAA